MDLHRRSRTMTPNLGTGIRIAPGSVLTVEGAKGHEFFVVERGQAGVSRNGQPVAVLGPGDHFGEIALLTPPAVVRPR